MAEKDFGDSIKEIVEDLAAGIHDRDQDQTATADSESAADQTPVRRKARIAPHVVRVAARLLEVRWIGYLVTLIGKLRIVPGGLVGILLLETLHCLPPRLGAMVQSRKLLPGKASATIVLCPRVWLVDTMRRMTEQPRRSWVVAVDTTRPSHGKVMAVSLGSTCVVRVTGLVAVQHVISSPGLWKLTSFLQSPSQLMYIQS